ncbi:hypothetical protein RMATCC62417_06466 [Rhizopus microsporus]|nr:hypothetical protein RMATCC62417_06466 [Rhizopus microsporus]
MMRSRSDLGRLQFRDVVFSWSSERQLLGVTLTSREPKKSQWKAAKLGTIDNVKEDDCLFRTFANFIARVTKLREGLPDDHTLFLAEIDNNNPCRSIRPATAASWIQQIMYEVGIDTSVHKAHSLRSAASIWAVQNGHSIDKIKKHANWSRKSDTFERFCYKPFDKFQESQDISTTIFSTTENATTSSEPRTEATMIGISMTSNQTVVEVEGEDEMVTRPSTFNWFTSLLFPSQEK